MKIEVKLNQLTHQEYIQVIKNRHKYAGFPDDGVTNDL